MNGVNEPPRASSSAMSHGDDFDAVGPSTSKMSFVSELSSTSSSKLSSGYSSDVSPQTSTAAVFPIRALPLTTVRIVTSYLRHSELANLAEAIPDFSYICDEETRNSARLLPHRTEFLWTRAASGIGGPDRMAERRRHSMAYLESDNAVYVFGGEAIKSGDAKTTNASFNDLFRLDLATMRWSRIVVRSSPYPLPKFAASLIPYKDELLLYGGRRSFREKPSGFLSNTTAGASLEEIHIFSPQTGSWRQVVDQLSDGPCLSGHSACMHGDYLIVFGGCFNGVLINGSIYVFNIPKRIWHTINIPGATALHSTVENQHPQRDLPYPIFCPGGSNIFVLRDGLLLVLGEQIGGDYGSGLLFEFDPDDLSKDWKWKKIDVSGRWWHQKAANVPAPNAPNVSYPQVVMQQCGDVVRLVSLGMPQKYTSTSNAKHASAYEQCQRRCSEFLRVVRETLEAGYERVLSADQSTMETTDEVISHDGIICRLENVYVQQNTTAQQKEPEKILSPFLAQTLPQHSPRVTEPRIVLESDDHYETNHPLDSVDLWELESRIRGLVAQFQVKHYNVRAEKHHLSPAVLARNSALRRFVVFSAEFSLREHPNPLETLKRIEWRAQAMQARAPPLTTDYCLVAGHDELILHGGRVALGESHAVMGYTYIMTPVTERYAQERLDAMPCPNLAQHSQLQQQLGGLNGGVAGAALVSPLIQLFPLMPERRWN